MTTTDNAIETSKTCNNCGNVLSGNSMNGYPPNYHCSYCDGITNAREDLIMKKPQTTTDDAISAKDIERKFVKWAEARDDDWWGENGHVGIWDVRIIIEFFVREVLPSIRSQSEADGARKERERLDRKVFVVFYRGNGYGPFNNIEIAEAFAKFIPNHNEKKFNTKQYGEYEANIQEWTLGKAIATLRAGMEERKGK